MPYVANHMSKKSILLLTLLAAAVLIAGCITDKTNPGNNSSTIASGLIPTVNLPNGFTFMAVHQTNVEVGNFSNEATEGVYRTDTGEDIYIQVFKSDNPEALINEYKAEYKGLAYNPFTEIYFNGHKATRVMYYFTSNGKEVPKYSLIWATKDAMIKVGSSLDPQKVINLATATNN